MINYGDKFEKRISLRLSDKQYDKLQKLAFLCDVSESQYIRMLLDSISLFNEDAENENQKAY